MLIEWEETNAIGDVVVKNHNVVTSRNAHTYAKRGCSKCHGRGYECWDNGYNYRIEQFTEEEYYPVCYNGIITEYPPKISYRMVRSPRNSRKLICDCVAKTLSKLEDLKKVAK